MEQQAKLIACESLEGEKLEFVILNQQQLGSGAFGVVKKAYEQSRQYQQLAAKIIPYGDQKAKQKINKEVEIMKQLDEHPNLVKVQPLKCFSGKNFYIFMQYCNQGTLEAKIKANIKKRQNFTEEEIFEAFYQILSGYKVLWKKKILHQDLKPDNILIKNGTYKITDFGFSIFHEGVKFQRQRQGTFPYMPLEKLTVQNYYASTKSDIFALGVIFFKMITGRHPYVLTQFQNYKEYILQLKAAELSVPNYIRGKMSLPMQHLFEVILKMVAKRQKDRIDFDQVYKFIADEEAFMKLAQNNGLNMDVHSEQIQLPQKRPVRFVEYSKAFMIPFSIPYEDETSYQKQLVNQQIVCEQNKKIQICLKIQRYLCSMRLMVYFFDRLHRKIAVQRMRKQAINEPNEDAEIQEKTNLCLLYLATKITTRTIEESRYMRVFTPEQWRIYKKTDPYILKLIRTDEQYLKLMKNEALMETKQSKIKDRHSIIQNSKLDLLEFMVLQVRVRLVQLLRTRTGWISVSDRKGLGTLNYIISSIDIIDNFGQRHEKWQQLQGFFRQMQLQEISNLLDKVTTGLDKLGIMYSLDLGEQDEQQQMQLNK